MRTKIDLGKFIAIPGKDYEVGETPVTVEQWASIVGNEFDGALRKHPMTNISWDDCQEFCGRVNALCDGFKYRLPTEAEWEHAARAGTTGDYWFPESEIEDHVWYYENSDGKTHPVGVDGHSNPWGLSDMLGHVWEWCEDLYDKSGSGRVLRGGSWGSDAGVLRSAGRSLVAPGFRDSVLGFRLVRSPLALGPLDTRPLEKSKSRAKPRRATPMERIADAFEKIERHMAARK